MKENKEDKLLKFDKTVRDYLFALEQMKKRLNTSHSKEELEKDVAEMEELSSQFGSFSDMGEKYLSARKIIDRKIKEVTELIKKIKGENGGPKTEIGEDTQPISPPSTDYETMEVKTGEEDLLKNLAKFMLIERGKQKDNLLNNFDLDGLKKELKRKEKILETFQDQSEKDKMEGFISIIKEVIGELETREQEKSTKEAIITEGAPGITEENPVVAEASYTDRKGPDEVKIEMGGLEGLLPPQFETLDDLQKVKVLEDLKRRIVDIVKSDAETQYSETLKQKGSIRRYLSGISKEGSLKKLEIKIFESLKNTPEGQKLISDDLKILTERVARQEVEYDEETGKLSIKYLNHNGEGSAIEEYEAVNSFNRAANAFTKIPYEWGQEKTGKRRKKYDEAKAEYEATKKNILQIKLEESSEGILKKEKGAILSEFLEIDNVVKMEQLLNTHPEFEKALSDFEKNEKNATLVRTGKKFLESATLERLGLMAGGTGARMLAKGAAIFSGSTIITAISAPVIGGTVGYWRGKFRARETLAERQKEARHGKKDENKERVVTTDVVHLNKRLESIMEEIENAGSEEEYKKKLAMLATRIEHTQGKIEKGQVNFGDSKSALTNQFNLANNLNRAICLKQMLSTQINGEIKERIDQLLARQGENIKEKTLKAQSEFIKKQAWKSAAYGASFATAGYVARWAGEHFGWWGNTEEVTSQTTEKMSPVTTDEQISTPKTGSVAEVVKNPEVADIKEIPSQTFQNEGIKFENGKGAIQAILDLKAQIVKEYNGDYSKAPQSVQDFMRTDATKEAIKLGLFDPTQTEESALIREGTIIKFDEKGNLLLGKPDASGNIPVLEKYTGDMFDSDKVKEGLKPKISEGPKSSKLENIHEKEEIHSNGDKLSPEEILSNGNTQKDTSILEGEDAKADDVSEIEKIKNTIKEKIDTQQKTRTEGITLRTGTTIGTGYFVEQNRGAGGENMFFDSRFPYFHQMGRSGDIFFRDLSPGENDYLNEYKGFISKNEYGLGGREMLNVCHFLDKSMEYYAQHGGSEKEWNIIRNMGAKEFLENETLGKEHKAINEYLTTLKEFVKPRGWRALNRAESIQEYMARAIQKLEADGRLAEFAKKIENPK